MTAHENASEQRPRGEAVRLDHEDADRLATEHGETDFAGFTARGDDGSAEATTATEQAALDEAGLAGELGEDEVDDRARPHRT